MQVEPPILYKLHSYAHNGISPLAWPGIYYEVQASGRAVPHLAGTAECPRRFLPRPSPTTYAQMAAKPQDLSKKILNGSGFPPLQAIRQDALHTQWQSQEVKNSPVQGTRSTSSSRSYQQQMRNPSASSHLVNHPHCNPPTVKKIPSNLRDLQRTH